jgi:hypothetical protein
VIAFNQVASIIDVLNIVKNKRKCYGYRFIQRVVIEGEITISAYRTSIIVKKSSLESPITTVINFES